MPTLALQIQLLSDTTFGRGDGVAGEVDAEVQHDLLGLPTISGRALKGLLVNAAADLLYACQQTSTGRWFVAASHLFGTPGALQVSTGLCAIGPATLAPDLVAALQTSAPALSREDVLASVTAIRRQTALDAETGAPRDDTLRAMRVVVRDQRFYAPVQFVREPTSDEKAFFAACVLAVRRMGTGRNRGRGQVQWRILTTPLEPLAFATTPGTDLTFAWFQIFEQELL